MKIRAVLARPAATVFNCNKSQLNSGVKTNGN
jgi:hypothetical protein